jgi:hypothetical protein
MDLGLAFHAIVPLLGFVRFLFWVDILPKRAHSSWVICLPRTPDVSSFSKALSIS